MARAHVAFRWQRHPGGRPTGALRKLAVAAVDRLGVGPVEIGVLVCDDLTIRSLNRHYRGKDRPTDVLSFPGGFTEPDGLHYLGDVAISLERAALQAAEARIPLERELKVLLLHAIVHLCGYDHETDKGEMAALEAELRQGLLR
ncbi:MAG: rRNA maturation RNase YbeY [Acidobacteriia bacterium]|nr:rRNA maturation RNase YbeY [Terriglobia bacterium]